ncbi:hypothetical protein EZS27_010357 [termite gut metagenome]|uniref:Uncharacterized protein n=1 Tax=termite gut metagenome TaxID=433724 RepID=A0A5J4S8Y0_9ZZZZ
MNYSKTKENKPQNPTNLKTQYQWEEHLNIEKLRN